MPITKNNTVRFDFHVKKQGTIFENFLQGFADSQMICPIRERNVV